MIASGYITVEPEYTTEGALKSIKFGKLTQKFTADTKGIVLKLEAEIPDEVFTPTKINVMVSEEYILARKPLRLFVVKDEQE